MKDINKMGMVPEATVVSNKGLNTQMGMIDYFHVECYDEFGNFKWKETIKNLVTTEGLNHVLDVTFASGTQNANWYVGLKYIGTPDAGDTGVELPGTTMNWDEYGEYDEATRPALSLGAISGGTVNNSGTPATFTIESPANAVYGVFVVDANTIGTNSNAQVLYGVGDFATQKAVDTNDTLNVTVTLTATSA